MAEPYPGLKIAAPERMPQQGEVVIRYEVREPKVGCCKCSDMSQSGLIALVALIFVCWPLACIPCCIRASTRATRCLSSGRPPTSRLCAHSSRPRAGHPHDRQGRVKGGATRGSRPPPPRRRVLCGGVLLNPCHAVFSPIILTNLRACLFQKK